MTLTVSIHDTIGMGKIQKTIDVSFQTDVVTVKDIIEARVWKEVDEYNNGLPVTGLRNGNLLMLKSRYISRSMLLRRTFTLFWFTISKWNHLISRYIFQLLPTFAL
jgi:hypothetical protein